MAVTRRHYVTRLEGLDLALRFILFRLCLVFQHVVFREVPVIIISVSAEPCKQIPELDVA